MSLSSFFKKKLTPAELAQVFFEMLEPKESALRELDKEFLAQHHIDEGRFRDEMLYLKAFAIDYSIHTITGDHPKGQALRAAFMDIWLRGARTSPAQKKFFDGFVERLKIYGDAVRADGEEPGTVKLALPGAFYDLLGQNSPNSQAGLMNYGDVYFNSTCIAVAKALTEWKP